jgi:hypothetical protein
MKLIDSPATNIQIEATSKYYYTNTRPISLLKANVSFKAIACILAKKKGKRRDYFLQQRIVEILNRASERSNDPNFKSTISSAVELFNSDDKKRNKRTKQKN